MNALIDLEYTWQGDVPPLTDADFVKPETCHGLHARIAELEKTIVDAASAFNLNGERDTVQEAELSIVYMAHEGARAMRERDAAIQQRNEAERNTNENADLVDEFICLFQKANQLKRVRQCEIRTLMRKLEQAEAERDAALHCLAHNNDAMVQRAQRNENFCRENMIEAQRQRDAMQRERNEARAELDAANKRAKQAEADARALAIELGRHIYRASTGHQVSIGSIDSHREILLSEGEYQEMCKIKRERGAKYLTS